MRVAERWYIPHMYDEDLRIMTRTGCGRKPDLRYVLTFFWKTTKILLKRLARSVPRFESGTP
jgi:hypothetical protein